MSEGRGVSENWRFVLDDLNHADVVALVELHLREAHLNSPPGRVFALDLSGLRDPAVTLWSAWDGDVQSGALLGIGALKRLDDTHGELKSMRTHPEQLRRGVAARMLDHLVGQARARGYGRVSLETGSSAAFLPARTLYQRAGFVECGPFATYSDTSFSRYFTRAI